MNCPNCRHKIPEDFYCIACGYVPSWARDTVDNPAPFGTKLGATPMSEAR
jgi:hypothetical protein